jgi:hypothetical protein
MFENQTDLDFDQLLDDAMWHLGDQFGYLIRELKENHQNFSKVVIHDGEVVILKATEDVPVYRVEQTFSKVFNKCCYTIRDCGEEFVVSGIAIEQAIKAYYHKGA